MTTANQSIDSDRPKKGSPRRKFFKLHSWVGFNLAFMMSVILATGTFATISYEIDWLLQQEMRVTPLSHKASWQTMTNSVEIYAPDSRIVNITALDADYLAYRATVKDEHNRRYFVHVDQWTGDVVGETGLITVQRVLRDLHRYLFMPKFIGLPIVSAMAFILLISLYTGLKTARNWRTLLTRVRFDKGIRVMVGDAHKAAGLWGIWFLVLIAITAIWYLAEFIASINAIVFDNKELTFESSRATLSEQRLHEVGSIIKTQRTSNIINSAVQAFPEIKNNITAIYFPVKPDDAIIVQGDSSNLILRPRANRVFLDREDLRPLKVQRSSEASTIAWLNDIADPLHFGFFGGLFTKIIWFIFGLVLTGLSITGVYLTWRRLKTKSMSLVQAMTFPVFLLAFLSAYFLWYPIYKAPQRSYSELSFLQNTDQGFNIELNIGINNQHKPDGKIRLLTKAVRGIANIKSASIELFNDGQSIVKKKRLTLNRLSDISLYTKKLSPSSLIKADQVKVTVKLNTGKTINSSWFIGLNNLN